MLTALGVIVAAGVCGFLAGCVLWWASHRSGLWNFAMALVLGVAVVVAALLIAYAMVRSSTLL